MDSSKNNKSTEEVFTPTISNSFGGSKVDLTYTPEPNLSGVSLEMPKEDTGISSLQSNDNPTTLTNAEVNSKVDKYSFALGKSFSKDTIHGLISTDNEETLRNLASASKDVEDEQDRQEALGSLLQSGESVDSVMYDRAKALASLKPKNNPAQVLEEAYAKRFTESIPDLGPKDNAFIRLTKAITDNTVEGKKRDWINTASQDYLNIEEQAKRLKVYQENSKDALERAEKLYASESTFGKVIDFGKSMVPFLDYYSITMDTPGLEAISILPGTSIATWVDKLYDQPPAVQKEWLNKAVDTIGAYNPALAIKVAEAATSYTSTDKFLDNLTGALDLPLPGDLKALGALGVAGARALKGATKGSLHEIINSYRTALRADLKPNTDPVDFQAAMGDINGAAVHASVRPSKAQGEGSIPQSTTPTYLNPEATPGSSQGIAGAQASRFQDFVSTRADVYKKLIEDTVPRVNRLPEEVLQMALDRARRDFENTVNQSINNVVQNARKVVDETPKDLRSVSDEVVYPNEAGLMSKIEAKYGKVDWTPDGKELPPTRSAIAEPNKALEDKLSKLIEAKRGPIPGPKEGENVGESPAPFPLKMGIESKGIRPEDTAENIAKVEFSISKPNGELFSGKYFALDMDKWAKWMGLPEGSYRAEQQGNGWKMVITQPLDETKPYIRNHQIDIPKNKTPMDTILSPLRRGGSRVSEFTANNRLAYIMGQEKTQEILKPLYEPIKAIDRDSVNALNRVMREEAGRIHPENNLPGHFYEDTQELSEAFQRLNGRSITPKEIDAYTSARTINNLELALRRDSYWKELVRLGLKRIELPTTKLGERGKVFGKSSFEGKVIDDLPLQARDDKARAIVAFYNEGSDPTFSTLALMSDADRRTWLKEKMDEGYKIIQTGNPVRKPGKEAFGEDENVNFIITKNFTVSELNPTDLIKEREGWHQIYPYQHWVKQPVIRKVTREDGSVHHFYDGETTLFGFHTKAEANKYAKAMEEARQIAFEGKKGDLERHLAENLPYSEKHFRDLFEDTDISPAYFSKTEPFHPLGDGEASIDIHNTALEARYSNLYDNIKSPWNLMNQVDKKFVGHRDEVLHTVKEGKGSQSNPVFNLTTADKLDPLSSMSMGISNMIRNQGLIDLRIQHAESWLQEFKHLLNRDLSEQALYGDLLNVVFNPQYIPGIKKSSLRSEWRQAENSRQALMELMNLETPLQMSLDTTRAQVLNQIYERMGQKWSNESATSKLATTRHPLSFFRGLVYHSKVGFLNPIPAIQNVMQIANTVAISPKHGIAGAMFGQLGYWTRLNSSKPIVDSMAEVAAKASGGIYKKEWFKEGLESMNRSGFFTVVSGHALSDHLNDPKLTKTVTGKVLDAGSVLFRESEKMLRTSAWMTSYLEWRSANPTKAMTSIDLNSILGRAETFAGRMSRAEKARWQTGEVLSTFTQFWSYQARLMEMIWEKGHGRGDTLTTAERLRLLGLNAIMYGIPIGGLGAAVGGLTNPYEHIKNVFTEHEIPTDNTAISLLMNGVLGHMSKSITGVNISPTFGPQGRDLTQQLDRDYGWFRFVGGPFGGVILDTYLASRPLGRETWLALNGKGNAKAIAADMWDIAQNVSTLSKGTKMYLAYMHQKAFTRSGQEVGDVETWPGIVSAITGQPVDKLEAIYSQAEVLKNASAYQRELVKEAQKDYRRMLETNDKDLEAHYAFRIDNLLAGIPNKEEAIKALHSVMQGDKSLEDIISKKWEQHKLTPDPDFEKAYGKYFMNMPKGNE